MRPDEAWRLYGLMRSHQRIAYAPEPYGLAEEWKTFTDGTKTSSNLWTDAYLSAFANATQALLVTFDQKIPPRADIRRLVLY